MRDFPDSFWAAIFMTEAMILAVLALYSPTKDNIILAVLGVSSNVITGSFAYIQGKKAGERSLQVPLNPDNGNTTSVTVNPTPAQGAPETDK